MDLLQKPFSMEASPDCAQVALFGADEFESRVRIVDENEDLEFVERLMSDRAAPSCLIVGDSKRALGRISDGVFQACVTSPPYWSLRNYDIDGQIGLELSLDEYLTALVEVFEEVRRVLRDDGTLWLNIGDSYTSGGRTWRAPDKKNAGRAMSIRPPRRRA